MNSLTTGNKAKILEMLGKGLTPAIVSSAVGISESYISQLLADEEFAKEVTNLRFANLQKHSDRDATYDSIEDKLLKKLEDVLPYMVRPGEILKSLQIVNGAKRRGADTAAHSINTQNNTIINLMLPKHVISTFATNISGQVVEAEHTNPDGSKDIQSLVTMPSGNVKGLLLSKLSNGKV